MQATVASQSHRTYTIRDIETGTVVQSNTSGSNAAYWLEQQGASLVECIGLLEEADHGTIVRQGGITIERT
jgi:hypothetical protein